MLLWLRLELTWCNLTPGLGFFKTSDRSQDCLCDWKAVHWRTTANFYRGLEIQKSTKCTHMKKITRIIIVSKQERNLILELGGTGHKPGTAVISEKAMHDRTWTSWETGGHETHVWMSCHPNVRLSSLQCKSEVRNRDLLRGILIVIYSVILKWFYWELFFWNGKR